MKDLRRNKFYGFKFKKTNNTLFEMMTEKWLKHLSSVFIGRMCKTRGGHTYN